MRKEKLEEKYNFVKNKNNFQTILNNINNFGKTSHALGQFLLFLLIIGSALSYGKFYLLDLQYQAELTFEQFITLGFSSLTYVILYIFLLYIPIEFPIFIKLMYPKLKWWGICIVLFVILYFTIISSFLLINSFQENNQFLITCSIYLFTVISLSIFIILNKKNQYIEIRIFTCLCTLFIFLQTDYSTTRMSEIGKYNATIMVDKNSFIKDIIDIEKPFKDGDKEKYTKNYHYKGDHIELKDVKILSTLGDIAYVELCSENIEIGKTLEKNCGKTIKVEFIKKDIHIIRDGKKQEKGKKEDYNNKTNNESKKQNEQDLEKSKENNKEENTTKNN